ncbi:HPr family phosphocarrier protein [Paenibacillus beijingensis]|uniref:Phosphocarrier protein HPr n=1 Tax=Paenibacillus beijingensis TaxID=1126833 RepID=A0A0D5NHE3_9BACL|nr:HPr family phosphocarrier protein [Paenibacillus beijingensis]AJY74804.1 hypothetical protein VN24_09645 [Paenibacillus beijingensis]
MTTKEIIMRQNGFHVLFAKKLTTAAASFESEIRIVWQAKNVISDAKSILGVMALDVTKGTPVTLTAEGPDEERAVEELAVLFDHYE